MKRFFYTAILTVFAVSACDFLEPLPDGSYNEDNYDDYPTIIRGYIDKAYNLRPSIYYGSEFIGLCLQFRVYTYTHIYSPSHINHLAYILYAKYILL